MPSQKPSNAELEDFTNLDRRHLEAIIADLAAAHPELIQTVNKTTDRLRSLTNARVKAAVGASISLREAELFENIEKQYPHMIAVLGGCGISTEGMPGWGTVEAGISEEILDKASGLAEPTLLLVPPVSRRAMLKAINKKYPSDLAENIHFQLGNNDLWNNGRREDEKQWRVCIVEGVENVKQLRLKNCEKRPSHSEIIGLLMQQYRDRDLDVISDANTYLTLAMMTMAAGKCIDTNRFTVLNSKTVSKDSIPEIAYGTWENGQVSLGGNSRTPISPYKATLRRLVHVPVVQRPLQK